MSGASAATPLYAVISTYGAGAGLRREAAMPDHLQYLRDNAYRLRFAGPTLADDGRTPTGSFAIVETPDRVGAEEFIAAEAFNRAGMFGHIEISRYASNGNNRQSQLAADPSRLLYLCRWSAVTSARSPDPSAARGADQGAVHVLEGGALLSDDGSRPTGALFIVETPDRRTAQRFLAAQLPPGRAAEADVAVSRWRFGQALSAAQPSGG